MRRKLIWALTIFLVFLGLLLIKVAEWIPLTFGDIPFEQVLFHMMVPMQGTDTSFISSFIKCCLPLPTIVVCVIVFIYIFRNNSIFIF